MNHSEELKEVLAEGCIIRLVEDDIYSALPDAPHKHLYDRRASAYDSIVSTWLYNRLMWGTSPLDYVAFAREAIVSHPTGQTSQTLSVRICASWRRRSSESNCRKGRQRDLFRGRAV